ncbi:MAG: hypothetical protein AAGN64_17435, partial [Bacteroidota bacterium]
MSCEQDEEVDVVEVVPRREEEHVGRRRGERRGRDAVLPAQRDAHAADREHRERNEYRGVAKGFRREFKRRHQLAGVQERQREGDRG